MLPRQVKTGIKVCEILWEAIGLLDSDTNIGSALIFRKALPGAKVVEKLSKKSNLHS